MNNSPIFYKGPYSPEYYKKLIANKKYYAAHKEKQKQRRREYYAANKEKEKQYREDNKERIAERNKQYREDNKERIADYQSQYYQSHKEEYNAQKRAHTSLRKLLKTKHKRLEDLKSMPHQPEAKRMLHHIKTSQVDFSLDGPLSQEEIESLNDISLPPIPSPQKRKYQGSARQNQYRENKKQRKQTQSLNKDFSLFDPNRVLPLSAILNPNYTYSYLPQREIFKIKNRKRIDLYDKWEKEYKKYFEEVKKISDEDKIKLLNERKFHCNFLFK